MDLKDIIIYVDMDDVLADFTKSKDLKLGTNPGIKWPQCEYGFFTNLDPMYNAVEFYKFLSEHFSVYILTAPSVDNPMCYTEKRIWVGDHLGKEAAKNLIISGHKHLNIGNYLIDDNFTGKGQDKFTGTLITFNPKTNNWHDIKEYFKKTYLTHLPNWKFL